MAEPETTSVPSGLSKPGVMGVPTGTPPPAGATDAAAAAPAGALGGDASAAAGELTKQAGADQGGAVHRKIGERVLDFIQGGQSPGTFWRGVLSGALTGMAAGASKGHFGQGAAAGVEAAQRQRQQQFENQQTKTRDEAEKQFKAAQTAFTLQQTAMNSWKLSHDQIKATQEDIDWNMKMKDTMEKQGAIHLGNIPDLNHPDFVALHKAHPELPKDIAQGNIYGWPSVVPVRDANGKLTGESVFGGMDAYYLPPNKGNQLTTEDKPVLVWEPGKSPDEPGHYNTITLPAGWYTEKEALDKQMAARNDAAKSHNDRYAALTEMQKQKFLEKEADRAHIETLINDGAQMLASDHLAFIPEEYISKRGGTADDLFTMVMKAKQLSPSYNPTQAKKAWENLKTFTDPGGEIQKDRYRITKAMRHLDSLYEAAVLMSNGQVALANKIAAQYGQEMNDPSIGNFESMLPAVGAEVYRGFTGVGATKDDIQNFKEKMGVGKDQGSYFASTQGFYKLLGEQLAHHFDMFNTAVFGETTPEKRGITIVDPDLQDLMKKFGLTPIGPGGPPRELGQQTPSGISTGTTSIAPIDRAEMRRRLGPVGLPNAVPDGTKDLYIDPTTNKVTRYKDPRTGNIVDLTPEQIKDTAPMKK